MTREFYEVQMDGSGKYVHYVGHEIGRFTGPNLYDWEQVERCGDI